MMDILSIILISMLLFTIVLLIWIEIHYKRKVTILRNENNLYKIVNEYQSEAVVLFSENFELLRANIAARKMLQIKPYREGEVLPKEILFQVGKSDLQTLPKMFETQSKISKGTIHLERVLMRVDGTRYHVNIYIDRSKWKDRDSIVCIFQDISSEYRENELIKHAGEVDFLTDLPSQFKANDDINRLVISAQRENKKIAFFIFGINNFNRIKKTFGFGYTNNILKKFSDFLRTLEDDRSKIYRFDCDNFLYMIEDIEDVEYVIERGEAISRDLSSYFVSTSKDAKLVFSIGIVLFPDHGRNASKLIDHAHLALADSVDRGDGSIVVFDINMCNVQENERTKVEEMKIGLEKNEFEVYYQPIVNLETNEVNAAEALVRWNHPKHGLLTTDKFIRLAEVSGLIMDIGEFVLEEVISQHKKWHEFGFRDIEISINISARELLTYHLSEKLEQLFMDHDVNPRYFNLDLSERDAIDDLHKTDYEFSILKDIGVNLSLDHFGTGGSSIVELQKLPIRTLKVDQSFIKAIDRDKYHQETFKAIIMLSQALNMDVVAAGVETEAQRDKLIELGCDFIQGHVFYKPTPAFEFQELLRE
jgi:diguanylate cyclase (GGDEF)-like protein/PAS domain S-box-containing protein